MSKLRVTSHAPDADASVVKVTPESAGWTHVGFEVLRLAEGERAARATGEREACLVLLSGRASVTTREARFDEIGERESVFDGAPYSVYVPAGDTFEITALTAVEVALCTAPGHGGHPARLIAPGDVGMEDRGAGTNLRKIRNVLPDSAPADSLLVVEVITPPGHWSSYPPHKHDRDALPEESYLEETYYHRINPPRGFAFQRVYTDDRSLDETIAVGDGDVVMVPRGYHPVGAPPGYELYYLNVMAGPRRSWVFHNDPEHAWILG
jgi:5-deoxy-glucuronate isomerase